MSGQYIYGIQRKYPHFTEEDKKIWERFILDFPEYFHSVDYDVRVSRGADIFPGTPEPLARDIAALSPLRIDVVGYKDNLTTIVEIKPEFDIKAIGELITYRDQYVYRSHGAVQPGMLGICWRVRSNDIYHSARRLNIRIITVFQNQ